MHLRGSGTCERSYPGQTVEVVYHFSEEQSCVEPVGLKMHSVKIGADCFGEEERRFFSGERFGAEEG